MRFILLSHGRGAVHKNISFFIYFADGRALLKINRSVYILSNDLLDTHRSSLSPNSTVTKALGYLC